MSEMATNLLPFCLAHLILQDLRYIETAKAQRKFLNIKAKILSCLACY